MRGPGRGNTAARAAAVTLAATTTLAVATTLAACTTPVAGPSATATPSVAAAPTASTSPSASPSTSATVAVDLTRPGVARAVVDDLLEASGQTRAIMVSVTRTEASVAVEKHGVAETWGYRNGAISQVRSDINFVSQATFVPADYALDDVGALFRAGRAVSGSDAGQELQIVDYSAGLVAMTVTTNPESRTVFFNSDGTLLPTLDFTSADGLTDAYEAVVAARREGLQLGFGSDAGVHLDVAGTAEGTINRLQRSARTPVIVTSRTEQLAVAPFDPGAVDPAVVWEVIEAEREAGRYTYDQAWTCVVDRRNAEAAPRMHFTVGSQTFTTNLAGVRVSG